MGRRREEWKQEEERKLRIMRGSEDKKEGVRAIMRMNGVMAEKRGKERLTGQTGSKKRI